MRSLKQNETTTERIGMNAPADASAVDFEFGPLEAAVNYRTRLVEEFAEFLRGDVLEIGAGIGQVTEILLQLPAVRSVTAIEPHPEYANVLRRRASGAGVVVGTSSALDAARAFDAILCVNVLEHIEDHEEELRRHHALLRARNGFLCLFVPARKEIYAPLDRDFGHWRRYNRPSLRAALEHTGFEIKALRYYNLAGYFAWWWTFKVRRNRYFDAKSVKFFDGAIFPWIHWFEHKICAPPFGQSLLAVAKAR